MAKRTFVLKGKRDQTVTLSYEHEWYDIKVFLNREFLGTIKNLSDSADGYLLTSTDGVEVRISLQIKKFGLPLKVTLNGKLVKEWRNSPYKVFIWSYRILFFFGIYHIVFGFISGAVEHDSWEDISFACILITIGIIYVLLWKYAKKLSIVPFVIASILYLSETIADISLSIYTGNAPEAPFYIWRLMWVSFLIHGIFAVRKMKMQEDEFLKNHVLPYY